MAATKYFLADPSAIERVKGAMPRISRTLPWLIMGLGVGLRCAHYWADRSLWLDEAYLALNIVHRSFLQLLQPLLDEQVAPIGFLMVEKLAVLLWGNHESALRLFPLVASLGAVPLFYVVARRCLSSTAILVSLLLFSLSSPMIYYAAEVKPYASDVTIALLLLFLAIRALEPGKASMWRMTLLGLTGVVAIWFSHPAIFVLAGLGVSLTVLAMRRKTWTDIPLLIAVGSLWVLNFLVLYVLWLRQVDTGLLLDYWQNSFMPFPPRSLAHVRWFSEMFFRVFEDPVGFGFPAIAAMIFILGGVVLCSERKDIALMLGSPVVFVLLGSGLKTYPFRGRLLLFLVPAIFLVMAAGIRAFLEQHERFSFVLKLFVVGLLVLTPLQTAANHLFNKPYLREEIKPVLSYMQAHHQEHDLFYIYYSAMPAFQYYQDRYGFRETKYIEGIRSRDDWRRYLDDLDQLRGHRRVWVLLSHVYHSHDIDERTLILSHLDWIGHQLASVKAYGAEAYLYDLHEPRQVQAPSR
jgi:Dolichyl-phosphate-mannose-protein mannosyltransferase